MQLHIIIPWKIFSSVQLNFVYFEFCLLEGNVSGIRTIQRQH